MLSTSTRTITRSAIRGFCTNALVENNVELKSRIPFSRGISCIRGHEEKREIVLQLLSLKDHAGLSFDTIAQKLGYDYILFLFCAFLTYFLF